MQQPELKLMEWQLSDWQEAVHENILSSGCMHKNKILPWLKQEGASAEARLSVYVDAYVLRLLEALRTNYSALHQLIGDDYFNVMACRYLKMYPPEHASIRWFGEHLSSFLKKESPYATVPSIAELAYFEWALRHTIDAADSDILTLESLQAINPEAWGELTFDLHPSLSILQLNWNAPQIWNALTEHEVPPSPIQQPSHWLVYRQPNMVSGWRSATPLEIAALDSIHHGLSFADLCEELTHLMDNHDAIPLTAATFLRGWVEQGLLSLRVSDQQGK